MKCLDPLRLRGDAGCLKEMQYSRYTQSSVFGSKKAQLSLGWMAMASPLAARHRRLLDGHLKACALVVPRYHLRTSVGKADTASYQTGNAKDIDRRLFGTRVWNNEERRVSGTEKRNWKHSAEYRLYN